MLYILFSQYMCIPLPPPISTYFPYTTLFRSVEDDLTERVGLHARDHLAVRRVRVHEPEPLRFAAARVGRLLAAEPCSGETDRKSTRLNSSHVSISYAVFCLKKKKYLKSDHY